MKNIEELLKEIGLEIPEDRKESFNKSFNENYKTISDYDNQKAKLTAEEDKVKTLTASLDKFKDVDPDALNKTITDLKDQLKNKDTEYAAKIADRDFNDLLAGAIRDAKGKNAKAITALLDVEKLKASKNQKDDIAAAIKELTKAEDSKMLFAADEDGEDKDTVVGMGNVIGSVKNGGGGNSFLDSIRAAAGLSANKDEK